LFLGIGIVAVVLAYGYPVGTMARMGPGMLPLILGGLLTAVGLALCVRSILPVGGADTTGDALPPLRTFRAALFVLLGLLVFAVTIRPMGLFLATVGLVLVSSRAEPGYSLAGAGVLAAVLAAMVSGIFVHGLGLPLRVWP
jgi:hypothetical protein